MRENFGWLVRVHGPGWLKTRGFRVSDNRNPPVLRLPDLTETLENKGSHPVNTYIKGGKGKSIDTRTSSLCRPASRQGSGRSQPAIELKNARLNRKAPALR